MRRFAPTVALTIVSGLAFALWTWLLFNTHVLAWLDAPSAGPGVDLRSDWGQIQSAVSFTLGASKVGLHHARHPGHLGVAASAAEPVLRDGRRRTAGLGVRIAAEEPHPAAAPCCTRR